MAVPMANDPPFATLNHFAADLGIPSESDLLRIGISLFIQLDCVISEWITRAIIRAGRRRETNHNCDNRCKYCHMHIQHPPVSTPSPLQQDHRMMFPCIQGSISFSKCFWEVVPSSLGSRSVFPRGFPASRLRTLCTRSHTCTRPLLDGFAVRRSYPVPKTQSTVEFKRSAAP